MKVRLIKDALIVLSGKKYRRKAQSVVTVPERYGAFLVKWGFGVEVVEA